jgi:hypothetical protein
MRVFQRLAENKINRTRGKEDTSTSPHQLRFRCTRAIKSSPTESCESSCASEGPAPVIDIFGVANLERSIVMRPRPADLPIKT